MDRALVQYADLDSLLMSELSVKEISRLICTTEKGRLFLVYNGESYKFIMGTEEVILPSLTASIPQMLSTQAVISSEAVQSIQYVKA